MSSLASAWDGGTSVGYPLLFGLVLHGSVVPVVPTGAVVGAAAAFAMTTDTLGLPLVLVVSGLAALSGDLITFAICRFGGPAAGRWVTRGQRPERIDEVRDQFRDHGWQIIVAGRLLPAGRLPVLVAAGALAHPWRRQVPASLVAAFLWALAYSLLGVLSGGIFDSPLLATMLAAVLVLVVSAVLNLVSTRRRRRTEEPEPEPEPTACESA